MSKNIINNILDNPEDSYYGIELPTININNKNYLIGLQYKNNNINYRNLYEKKKEIFEKIGVIKYLTPKLQLSNSKDYEIFIADY